ncbi:MAG: TRAP transporter small permease [Pseudomonadota bacterium]
MGQMIRRWLDRLYLASGIISALFLIAIVCLILLQVASRTFGFAFRGGSDYSGYAMAAASFFGFAYALNTGSHIRVSLLLNNLGRFKHWGEVWCFGIGTAATTYFAWHACAFTYQSWRFGEVSSGLDATPLWMPQMSMAIGSVIFAICFWDNLVTLLLKGQSNIVEGGLGGANDEHIPAEAIARDGGQN